MMAPARDLQAAPVNFENAVDDVVEDADLEEVAERKWEEDRRKNQGLDQTLATRVIETWEDLEESLMDSHPFFSYGDQAPPPPPPYLVFWLCFFKSQLAF
ncbi:hypothetical protein NE237_023564 [Protea cynaroides]|uniref:Uncharacterized protein n=1 Tax=Protea cynaroides TaxID=273540 RepID=A0A9Q0HFA8_9MAGN|nr:hypothetical protein NE237_023564 [Protea cynaroides]